MAIEVITSPTIYYTNYAAKNSEQVSSVINYQITMDKVFNTWSPISCDQNGTNQNASTAEQITTRAAYYYDATNNLIVNTYNSNAYGGFLSSETYNNNYVMEYCLDQTVRGGDDDLLQFICAYMIDSKGIFHTISVNRIGGDSGDNHKPYRFCLMYDNYTAWPYNVTPRLLLANNTSVPYSSWAKGTKTNIKVQRTPTTITAWTTHVNQTAYNYSFTWTMPTSKPSDWTQEQYDNIKYMMTNNSKIGFGTESNESGFKVLSSSGLFNERTIYKLDTNEIIKYKDTTKISSEKLDIRNDSIVVATYTNQVFLYKDKNTIIELKTV